jgi:hypothetical protein
MIDTDIDANIRGLEEAVASVIMLGTSNNRKY